MYFFFTVILPSLYLGKKMYIFLNSLRQWLVVSLMGFQDLSGSVVEYEMKKDVSKVGNLGFNFSVNEYNSC